MSITGNLLAFGVRYVLDASADHRLGAIKRQLADHAETLPRALARANDRAWEAVGLALAGDSRFGRIKDLFRDCDLKGVRDQIRAFLQQTPTGLEAASDAVRAKATEEWLRLRKANKLSAGAVLPAELARRVASMERHGDPARMAAAAHRAVADAADALRPDAPHLAGLLTAAPAGGTPLLAAAFAFFFRRELETNPELARGLSFDFLRQISGQQEQGFALLDGRTSGILDQIGLLFDALDAAIAGVHTELDAINAKLDQLVRLRDVPTSTSPSRSGSRSRTRANWSCSASFATGSAACRRSWWPPPTGRSWGTCWPPRASRNRPTRPTPLPPWPHGPRATGRPRPGPSTSGSGTPVKPATGTRRWPPSAGPSRSGRTASPRST